MLRFGLVILLATSSLAAPSISLTQYDVNEIGYTRNDGSHSSAIKRAFEFLDGGDMNVHMLTATNIISDMAGHAETQGLAYGQTVALLGELASGVPGDACVAASYIEAFASRNHGSIRSGLNNFIRQVASNIDAIVKLVVNPTSSRYSVGARGGCSGGGRSYPLEAAWNAVFDSSSAYSNGYINEVYCSAKRLYNAYNVHSNNLGAVLTASSLPPSHEVFNLSSGALSNFLRALASGGNPSQAAASAKQALLQAVAKVKI